MTNKTFWRVINDVYSIPLPRVFLSATLFLCLSRITVAADADGDSFVAYGASAADQEVVAVKFNQNNGILAAKIFQRVPIGIEAAPVLYHSEHRRLYIAALRNGNQVVTFEVGKAGDLKGKKNFPLAHGSAYLSFDSAKRFLLSASYFEGHVDVYKLEAGGALSEPVCTVFQERDKAHAIRVTNDNRFAYVPYVKDQNALFQYAFDAKTGKLTPLDPVQAKVAADSGPRHIAYHPTKPFVYFSNEQHLGASVFRIGSDGQLSLLQVCDPGSLKPTKAVAASDIEITPDGKFIFVAVRDFGEGTVHAIHRYGINDDGTLKHLGHTPADAIPWGLQLSPSGRYLLVTASRGNTLTAYSISKDGGLDKQLSIEWGKMIRDIAVVVTK